MVLFGLPFLVGGLVAFSSVLGTACTAWRAMGWKEVPCTVESASLEGHGDAEDGHYLLNVSYTWRRGGRDHRSHRVTAGPEDNLDGFQSEAARELAAVAGKPDGFRCFVNPDRPDEAVLYRSVRTIRAVVLSFTALLFSAVGGALVFLESPGFKPRRTFRVWCLIVIGTLFASLFLTDHWDVFRVVVIVLLGIVLLVLARTLSGAGCRTSPPAPATTAGAFRGC
jgi:hypothetical protein